MSRSAAAGLAALIALLSSRAFIDYTTSGLENPLNYLLLALFCAPFFRLPVTRSGLRSVIFLAALVGCNRLDLLLLLLPAALLTAWVGYRTRALPLRGLLLDVFVFSAPLWGWLLFATIYFGYLFPNTYYAKLSTGIPAVDHIKQGLLYYANSVNVDPATLLVNASALVLACSTADLRLRAAALGLLLYLRWRLHERYQEARSAGQRGHDRPGGKSLESFTADLQIAGRARKGKGSMRNRAKLQHAQLTSVWPRSRDSRWHFILAFALLLPIDLPSTAFENLSGGVQLS
ncbi:MAG: hypothetical protein ABI883_00865 [Chthoniobacterales bacterium]